MDEENEKHLLVNVDRILTLLGRQQDVIEKMNGILLPLVLISHLNTKALMAIMENKITPEFRKTMSGFLSEACLSG